MSALRSLPLTLLFVGLLGGIASGQGLLIDARHPRRLPRPWVPPRPEVHSTYKVTQLTVDARLKDQVARVQVSQTFRNTGSSQMEVQFCFPLPYDGAIDQLTLLVNGEEFPGELLPRDEARKRYEAIVRASKDPALLEWMGTGMFQTSVFPVPAGEERTVTLHYNQLLRKHQGVTDFIFPLGTARYSSAPVGKIDVRLSIESTLPIKSVYSPSHEIKVKRPEKKIARIEWSAEKAIPAEDFRLFYDVNAKKLGTSVLSYRPDKTEDGYFLMLTTPQLPEKEEQVPKTILFVVDKSGSMSGEKIEQAKAALRFVLNNLREKDLFNIVAYDSDVESFRPELEAFNETSRKEALGYVEGLYAGGGTNIEGALTSALDQIQDTTRPNYLLFLTDGLPTVGERNEAKIAASAKKANEVRARLLNFGVGYDVNSRLLDRLATENFGASEYVRPNEDIEAHVSKVYSRIASPVLTDVSLTFEMDEVKTEDGDIVNRRYPSGAFDLFAGEQMVIVGRYRKPGRAKVKISGKVGDEEHKFDFAADLVEHSSNQSLAFVEKLWAMRRIGEIIDELDLHGRNEELTKELVLLSTKHGILTPYTSFLADENARPSQLAGSGSFFRNTQRSLEQLQQLDEVSGRSSVAQRSQKQELRNADRPVAAPISDLNGAEATEFGASIYSEAETDSLVVTDNVRQVGNYALYRRGDLLMTSEAADELKEVDTEPLDASQLDGHVTVIQRYSDEYFELTAANDPEQNRLLASQRDGERLLVRLRGQNYLIE